MTSLHFKLNINIEDKFGNSHITCLRTSYCRHIHSQANR